MEQTGGKSFSILCDTEGKISEILHNEDNIIPLSGSVNTIYSLVSAGDLDKVINFFLEVKSKRVSIGWEINIITTRGAETFTFFGGIFGDKIGIAAATVKNNAKLMFADMTRINNEQSNLIRSLSKANSQHEPPSDEPSVAYYEELSRLNNDLVNMQRELSKKNRELDELNKLKNRFLGIAAHDLRNPLGVIMGYSSYILDDSAANLTADQIEMLKSVLSSSEFMLRLLNDLLDISAIESGKVNLELVKANILPLVRKNVELNNVIANKKNITIYLDEQKDIPPFLFDASKIEQVLNNLISNAVKYSHPGTTVQVGISYSPPDVIIAVADQGQGIPENELVKLFKPFEKTSVQSTSGEKSTGLGLSIVRNLITAHKGKIWVESKVGEGSVFYFSIPVQVAE